MPAPRCQFCGGPVPSPDDPGRRVYEMVEGWAERRQAGGTHALVGIRHSGALACGPCIRVSRAYERGSTGEQGTLL